MKRYEIKALKLVKMPLRGVVTDREIHALRARNAERLAACTHPKPAPPRDRDEALPTPPFLIF